MERRAIPVMARFFLAFEKSIPVQRLF